MHAEVVDNKAGKCPLCGMTLVPVRLALVWSCPVHGEVTADAAREFGRARERNETSEFYGGLCLQALPAQAPAMQAAHAQSTVATK